MVNATAPIELTKLFTDVQVNDFLYGDYALDEDTHMEVQAALFTFTTTSDASGIFDTVRGSDTPDANGLIKDYNDVTGPGQYEFYFQSGTRLGVMICRCMLKCNWRNLERPHSSQESARSYTRARGY